MMKQKIALFVSGLLIYFVFGILMIVTAGKDLPNKWLFLAIWTVSMSLVHFFIMEPLRVRMAKKKADQKK